MEIMQSLIEKMKTQICYIESVDRGTGFFCKIPYENNMTLKVLITAGYILNENDILIGKKIKFSINDDKIKYEILIDESRKIFRNENYNITIIKIKPNDLLKEISFFLI